MLDFDQQANQALVSLDDDWHLLEGEYTTFTILFSLAHICIWTTVFLCRCAAIETRT